MKKIKLLIMAILSLVIVTGCSQDKQKVAKEVDNLQVITTFYPMYDFTKKVVGDKGTVTMLITGETEPHDYEPSAKDIAKIQDADIFVYNSKEMESWVESVLDSIDTSQTTIVEASEGIELLEMNGESEEDDGHAHGVDPHLWLDPTLAQVEVKTIAEAVSKTDAANKEIYAANSQQFIEELKELDGDYQAKFKDATQRDFVTQHAAFGYLAARYDLHQLAVSGISPDQEPNPAELSKIEDFVKENKVAIIYTEELSSSKIAKTIAEATGAKLLSLNTLEGLSQADQENGQDYLSVMRANLDALSKSIK